MCSTFGRTVVVLNVGNIIDMKWVAEYNPQAVLYAWQGGMEGGHGVADVLTEKTNPSGRLSDTIVRNLEDYPTYRNFGNEDSNVYEEDIYVGYRYFETFAQDKVLYPFGYGLSYTTFIENAIDFCSNETEVQLKVDVTNTGHISGKQVVQIYVNPPQGMLGKPIRNLVCFGKTKLLQPGEVQRLTFDFSLKDIASYDDGGITGNRSCYVLEAGTYEIYAGSDVRSAKLAGRVEINHLLVTEKCSEA